MIVLERTEFCVLLPECSAEKFHKLHQFIVCEVFLHGFLPQRALAPLAAIWVRLVGANAAARAIPPFRPSETAAGSLAAGGSVFGLSPMDSRKTWWASWIGSRGRFVAMNPV